MVLHLAYQGADLPFKRSVIEFLRGFTDLNRELSGIFTTAFANRQQELNEILLHPWCDTAYHPQLEQGQASTLGEPQVTRMRIGMDHAVHQHLLEIGFEQFIR